MHALPVFILLGCLTFCTRLQGQGLTAKKYAEGVEISEGRSKVLFYQLKPKSLDGKYERSNYIHPLYSLDGNILTEDFPDDHPHHRGIFWAWHQIIYKGRQIADGWSCENISWEVVSSNINEKKNQLSLDNEVLWKSSMDGGPQMPIIRENSRITVYSVRNQDYRLIDFEIRLNPLTDDLKIGGSDDPKGYGGFSLRFKLPDDILFVSKQKKVQAQELAVTAGPWLDFYGSLDGKGLPESGVAVFCHPSNPGFPEPWILRSVKSMQNPAYPGRVPVKLTSEGMRFQYRVVIHEKSIDPLDIEKLYEEYSKR
ncbi:MAG: PmoA family protein [Cyclobacteriaceae bacterium]